MKKVNLYVFGKEIFSINATCYDDENIESFLKRILDKKITIEKNRITSLLDIKANHKIQFILIDSNYQLLYLHSTVPDKFIILCININNISYQINSDHPDEILLLRKYIEQLYYPNLDSFIDEKLGKKKSEVIKISKDTFDKIIKPVITYKVDMKKKEEKPVLDIKPQIVEEKDSRKKPVKKEPKKKKEPSKIQFTIPEESLKKNDIIEKKPEIKKTPIVERIKSVLIIKKDMDKDDKRKTTFNSVIPTLKKNEKIEVSTVTTDVRSTKQTVAKTNNSQDKKTLIETKKDPTIDRVTNVEPMSEFVSFSDSSVSQDTTKKQEKKTPEKKKTSIDTPVTTERQERPVSQTIEKETSFNNNEENSESKEEKFELEQTISITIFSPTNEPMFTKTEPFQGPISVEQLLLKSGFPVVNKNGFIESIGGIKNEGMSGWVFEINHKPVMVPATECMINPNDTITWKYIDFSKLQTDEEVFDIKKEDTKAKILKKKNQNEQPKKL